MPPVSSATITIRLFARYAEVFRASQLELPAGGIRTVRDVLERLKEMSGEGDITRSALVAVNLVQARPDTEISPSDEIALLPPLAGG
jgi:molybdopterin converting factor small subunit